MCMQIRILKSNLSVSQNKLFGRRFDSAQVHKNTKLWKKNLLNLQELMDFLAHKKD
jgi:hypothetical protein